VSLSLIADVMNYSQSEHMQQLVLIRLANRVNESKDYDADKREGWCFPRIEELCADLHLKKRTLIEHLGKLEASGEICIARTPGKQSRYLVRPGHHSGAENRTLSISGIRTGNIPGTKNRKERALAHFIPDDFSLTPEMRADAVENGIANPELVFKEFVAYWQSRHDAYGCQFCHRHTGYVIWGGCVEGKEAALMRAWGVKSERMSESIGVLLPAMLNQFSSEYAAGLWPEFVDDELICLGDDDLDERIAEAQGIEATDIAELPDAIPAGYGDSVWMSRDKIGKYLLSADDAKYLCGKAA
jgi:hypothetical protein